MVSANPHIHALEDIRQMMKRSTRFLTLSGLSGIAVGCWALAGAYFAFDWIAEWKVAHPAPWVREDFEGLILNLLLLAVAVIAGALFSAFYFTRRRSEKEGVALWDHALRQMLLNLAIPLVSGGLFILAMLKYGEFRLVAPGLLVFYGLALINGGKYTVSEVRYLGLTEIALGLVATQYPGMGLYFWTAGFGLLHIIYGSIMWFRYERKES
jgi:heme/copper-type cytochrome/quinol oxidase subunit 3